MINPGIYAHSLNLPFSCILSSLIFLSSSASTTNQDVLHLIFIKYLKHFEII